MVLKRIKDQPEALICFQQRKLKYGFRVTYTKTLLNPIQTCIKYSPMVHVMDLWRSLA
jgi:hypothetical protein